VEVTGAATTAFSEEEKKILMLFAGC